MRLHPARAVGLLRAPWIPGWSKDPLWRQARSVPSLDLRFADNKSLVDATTGQNLVTFSRANGGTYVDSQGVIKTALDNEPRFDHNPSTGESLGLLVEEQRSNLLLRSEEFDNASWSKGGLLAFGSGSTANAITAPTGTVTADLLTEDTSTGQHRVWQTASNTVNTNAHTVSFYAKAKERTRIYVGIAEAPSFSRQGNATFDLGNGTVISFATGNNGATGGTASIVDAGNGWYRCSYSLVLGGTNTSVFTGINIVSTGSTISYTGDGTSGIYIWGAQLEVGAFPTSFIKTEAATATRAADVVSITGTNFSSWYSSSQGALHVECRIPFDSSTSVFPLIAGFSDGTFNNTVYHYNRTIDDGRRASVRSGGVASFDQANSTAYVYGQTGKQAFAYAGSDFAFSAAGASPTVSTSITWPTANRAGIGSTAFVGGALSAFNGTIRRLTYWPQRLSNATLQSITR